jgi:MFS transporter, DHA3 family, macrolide efflux protein
MIAIPWYFAHTLHQSDLFGTLYLIVTICTLFWGSYVGILIDRYNRKNIFLIVASVGFVALLISAIISQRYDLIPWYFAILPFVTTAFIYNIHFPNLYSFAQEITEPQYYTKITGALEVQGQLAFALSGALASFLMTGTVDQKLSLMGFQIPIGFDFSAVHLSTIFFLNAVTYGISFFILWIIKFEQIADRKIDTGTVLERFRTGYDFLRSNKHILYFGIFSLFVFSTILVNSTLLMPIYVEHFLKAGGDVYANSEMFFALGAICAGFFTTSIFKKNYIFGVAILSISCALMFVFFFVSKSLFVFFLAHTILGFSNAAIRILRVTFLFEYTPNSVIGRTNSVFFASNVFWRMIWIGLISIPMFSSSSAIAYICLAFAGFCVLGAWGVMKKV